MNKTYKQSMEVGYYFSREIYNNDSVEDWYGSEECATFTKAIVDYAEENECDIDFAFYELASETVNRINDNTIPVEEHAWDDYCKGFLAGEILGYPTADNLDKAKKAEKLWNDEDSNYRYYQEVLGVVAYGRKL